MRQYLIGLAAAAAVAATSAPATAGCGGCGFGAIGYSSCVQPVAVNPCGYGAGWGYTGAYAYGGGWGYATLPAAASYYAQPQYYYVNQGPTYTGPGMFAPLASYQQRGVAGWNGYDDGYYGYSGGPYANPVYGYRRAYAPRVWGRSVYAPRVGYRYGYRGYGVRHYGYRGYVGPRHSAGPYYPRYRVLRRYN